METDRQHIEDQAAAFLQRRETGPWTATDEAELAAWLEFSTAHRVAYLRIEAAWEVMGRLKALGAGLPPRQVPTPEAINAATFAIPPERPPEHDHSGAVVATLVRRRSYVPVAAAASVLVAAGLVLWGYQSWFRGERYTTPVGGLASVPLEDGSRITLNTSSQVHVVLSNHERHIDLNEGEAFFEVAKDARRPFVVQAEHTRVIAVGTQFSVRRDANDVIHVLVTEGKVRVIDQDHSGAATVPNTSLTALTPGSAPDIVSAGEVAQVGADGLKIHDEPAPAAEDSLAWRSGYLVFKDTSLAEAVAEFNRYSVRQIVVEDPAIGQMPLTGKFRASNSEAFVGLLEQTFHIQAQRESERIVLSRNDVK